MNATLYNHTGLPVTACDMRFTMPSGKGVRQIRASLDVAGDIATAAVEFGSQ